jgi:hypothetical protein
MIAYVPSRLPTNHHPQQNSVPSLRSPASEGSIACHQHRSQNQPSRPSLKHTRTIKPPQSTAFPPPATTTIPISVVPTPSTYRHQPLQQRPDNYRHQFQSIIHNRLSANSRPYMSAPRPYDIDGNSWCKACTAQLSDDQNTPGLRDPDLPDIRYRLRLNHDKTNHQPTVTLTRTSLGSIAATPSTNGKKESPPRANKPAPASYPPSRPTPTTPIPPTPRTSKSQSHASSTNAVDQEEDVSTVAPINATTRTTSPTQPWDPYRRWFHRNPPSAATLVFRQSSRMSTHPQTIPMRFLTAAP